MDITCSTCASVFELEGELEQPKVNCPVCKNLIESRTIDIKCKSCSNIYEIDENTTEDFLDCPECNNTINLVESIYTPPKVKNLHMADVNRKRFRNKKTLAASRWPFSLMLIFSVLTICSLYLPWADRGIVKPHGFSMMEKNYLYPFLMVVSSLVLISFVALLMNRPLSRLLFYFSLLFTVGGLVMLTLEYFELVLKEEKFAVRGPFDFKFEMTYGIYVPVLMLISLLISSLFSMRKKTSSN